MATINYDAIAQELNKGLKDVAASHMGGDKAMMLKELYTLSMGGPRQSGKTTWVAENLICDPNARAVVINTSLETDLINKIKHYNELSVNTLGQASVPTATGRMNVPYHVAIYIKRNPQAVNEAMCNVLTVHRFKEIMADDNIKPVKISQIFIDGRVQIFNRLRYSKYYTWLADQMSGCPVTWLID